MNVKSACSLPTVLLPCLLLQVACGGSKSTPAPAPPPERTWVVPDGAAALTAPQVAAFGASSLYYNAHTPTHSAGEIRGQIDRGESVRLAILDGAQETPAVTTTAFGAGMLSVDTSSGRVGGFLLTSGLVDATAAHVHLSSGRGVGGGVIVPLAGGPHLWVVPDGAAALTADQITAFQAGQLYFNAHTSAHSGGEIRGQLDKVGTIRLAALDNAQEPAAAASSAYGAGVLSVDTGSGQVAGFITTSGLVAPSAAHVHLSSGRGVAGGVIVPLIGGPDLWVVPDGAAAMTAPQITGFGDGTLYFNAHTPTNSAGEIRGQIDKVGDLKLAVLDGAQEVPTNASTAFGAGVLLVDGGSGQVAGFLATTGLVDPSAAHVHLSAGRGVSGGVIVPLAP